MTTEPLQNLIDTIRYAQKRYGVSDEALEYRRRRGPARVIEPSESDWAEYREACAAAEVLEKASLNPRIYVGPIEIDQPSSYREPGDYVETEDEWIARVAELVAKSEGRVPDDLGRALPMGEALTLLDLFEEIAAGIKKTAPTRWAPSPNYQTGGLMNVLPTITAEESP